jgi:hypothetical protein
LLLVIATPSTPENATAVSNGGEFQIVKTKFPAIQFVVAVIVVEMNDPERRRGWVTENWWADRPAAALDASYFRVVLADADMAHFPVVELRLLRRLRRAILGYPTTTTTGDGSKAPFYNP